MQAIPILGGRYRLGPEIASGGMGAVHRAWDERFEREVAIKVVRSGADKVERERLRREAQYLAHLDHPNLVAVLDAGEDRLRSGDAVWFAMELVAGPDLRTLLRRDGVLDGVIVRGVLDGVLSALHALHTAGVVHRDLKPANVLLTADPTAARWAVKVVDLGIAHHARTDHLTSTGEIVGTAAYLSPEQVLGREIGPATDVYALGLVALEMLTGRLAFPGSAAESATARLVRAPDLPTALDPVWREVLTAMTALEPGDRPQVEELLQAVVLLPDAALRADAHLDETVPVTTVQARPAAPAPATAVLPGGWAEPADAPTAVLTAAAPAGAAATAVEIPPRRRRRQHLLAVACVLAVLAAAIGWTAALTGSPQQTAAAAPTSPAAEAVRTAPPPSKTPTATPTATATPPPTAVAVAPVVPVATQAPDAAKQAADAAKRMEKALERFRKRHRDGGDRWSRGDRSADRPGDWSGR